MPSNGIATLLPATPEPAVWVAVHTSGDGECLHWTDAPVASAFLVQVSRVGAVSELVDTSADHASRRLVRTGICDQDGKTVGITALHHVDALAVGAVGEGTTFGEELHAAVEVDRATGRPHCTVKSGRSALGLRAAADPA